MKFIGISFVSFSLTAVVLANAYYQKKQFYPSVVYITKSNPSMAVMYIQAFIGVWILGKLMRKVFFGQLRTTEFEHLMERSWYAITETCLAFTVFRDDFTPKFVALFTLLLFLKSFHWLAEDRVDFMERSPMIGWLFHIRVLSLLLLLGALDSHFIIHAFHSTITKGASVQLVFGFEYAVLITVVVNIGIKYALHSVDLHSETPWDNKAVFLLYTELVMGFIKVILYVAFVAIMVRIYTLPLFAFRPMYYTIRDFKKAFSDVILSRRAIHNMNTLYPDATPEELLATDNVCIICREEMATACKKLPCNHIFHTSCLRSWFQRQQTCPTCRLNILRAPTPPTNNNVQGAQPPNAPLPPNGPNQFFNMFAAPNQFFNNQVNPGVNVGAVPPPNAQAPGAEPAPAFGPGPAQPGAVPPPPPAAFAAPFGFPTHAFPIPFPMPFMAPPPMPPTNLAALSEEELRNLEGHERRHVEARIQCLRNIQTLLDAAVQMMQQYSVASSVSSVGREPPASGSAPPAGNGGSSSDSVPNNPSAAANENAGETPSADQPPEASGETASVLPEKSPKSNNSDLLSEASSTSAEEEIRRRRLQRFLLQEQEQQQN
ncbi:E3 ubiquitin-protein ligase synoviolin isoform X2 [Dendroctonus ponderosae]|uniref:E3 ubiquitin-protein ligase synoviolin isoform X2 n=1 Tax=Dendroctonus ponderosae TaxID=77166 RepID=UPI00203622C1|nr:E3 ubiquitin-protein ligase synoviolin isoform X2 [Dendroctonus ponderosae]